MNQKTLTPLLLCGLAAALLLAPLSARAATFTDDFSADHDYQLGDTTGTIWNGMHNIPLIAGTGQFQALGGTLKVDTNGVNTGWEGGRSTAPLLFHTVPAGQDFTATVKISSQTTGQWSSAGIIARAQNATPPGLPPDNDVQNYAAMYSFRTNAASATEGVTLMKRIELGAQIQDVSIGINSTTPPNQAALPLLVRMERINGGTTYRGYVSTDNGATWQFQSRLRPNAGNALRDATVPMEVGLSFMNFSTLVGTAELDDFVLDTHDPLPAPGAASITPAINLTAHPGDILMFNITDLSGHNNQPMGWNFIADAANPAAPPTATTIRSTPGLLTPGSGGAAGITQGGKPALADALGVALPTSLPQDGSTIFRWNTNVMQAPAPNVLPAQSWTPGTYKWTIRATNDWLQVSNDMTLTVRLIPEPSTFALGGTAMACLVASIRRRRR
jgi:hypothetical protein